MRVMLWSASGRPINPAHKESIKTEMNQKMDELEEQYGRISYDKAKDFQDILVPFHKELMKKYPISEEIDLPTSKEEFELLCEKYGTAIAFCIEKDELVGYIMDSPGIDS